MSNVGRYVWFELFTADPAAAPAFYAAVTGWKTQKWEGGDYTMWVSPAGPIGGVMALPEQAKAMGAPPHWMGFVGVAVVDQTAERVKALGGQVYVPPTDIPGAGRFALLADPQGATFGVHQGMTDQPPMTGLGTFGWSELMSADPDAGFAFYSELFGWQKSTAMDMGDMGTYQMFGPTADPNDMIGGMMRKPTGMPVSAWLHSVRVPSADEAAEVVKAHGGQVMNEPMDIPGGGRAAAFTDAQGAAFGVFSDGKV
jgi:predicted enzyme related to lactoylglutathione lyase